MKKRLAKMSKPRKLSLSSEMIATLTVVRIDTIGVAGVVGGYQVSASNCNPASKDANQTCD